MPCEMGRFDKGHTWLGSVTSHSHSPNLGAQPNAHCAQERDLVQGGLLSSHYSSLDDCASHEERG